MSKLKPVHILIIVAVIIVLGAAAWSVGWAARRLVGPNAAPTPTAMEIATATEQSAPTAIPATAAPSTPSPVADDTPQATSTAMPVPTKPTEKLETVEAGEGLYQVCRRHCQGKWPQNDVPPDLERYARETAQTNNLTWPNPSLSTGQKLQMPPCPED
jgi:hypothetical protein